MRERQGLAANQSLGTVIPVCFRSLVPATNVADCTRFVPGGFAAQLGLDGIGGCGLELIAIVIVAAIIVAAIIVVAFLVLRFRDGGGFLGLAYGLLGEDGQHAVLHEPRRDVGNGDAADHTRPDFCLSLGGQAYQGANLAFVGGERQMSTIVD